MPELLARRGIVPGIKVDKGTIRCRTRAGDLITQGLDGLAERLKGYKAKGARFAKWREVYAITDSNPTPLGIAANAEVLARYAAICQEQGIVPIVEPEVLIDGDHTLERCHEVTEAVLHAVFDALHPAPRPARRHGAQAEHGAARQGACRQGQPRAGCCAPRCDVLKRTVPAAVPTINFLSGGQKPEEATANLNAMNAMYPQRAVGAVVFLCARAAGSRDARLGRQARERRLRAAGLRPPAEDEQPRAARGVEARVRARGVTRRRPRAFGCSSRAHCPLLESP